VSKFFYVVFCMWNYKSNNINWTSFYILYIIDYCNNTGC
jgi:hypothetical protein